MKIELVRIGENGVKASQVNVPQGATVAVALREAQIETSADLGFGIFARRVSLETVLKPGDRLEVAEPLLCDIKKVRSERALKQGDIRVVTCGRHGGRRRVVAKD